MRPSIQFRRSPDISTRQNTVSTMTMPTSVVHGFHGTVSSQVECDLENQCASPSLSGEQSKEGNANIQLFCSLCKITVNSASQLQEHCQGTKHKTIMEASSGLGPIKAYPRLCFSSSMSHSTPERTFHCEICNIRVNSEPKLKQHISSRRHRCAGKLSPHSNRHKSLSSAELMSNLLLSKDLPNPMSVTAVMSDTSSNQLALCTTGMSPRLYLPIIHVPQFNHAFLRPAVGTFFSSSRPSPY